MPIDEVFPMDNDRVVVTGRIATGVVHMDDDVYIGHCIIGTVQSVKMSGELLEEGEAGNHVSIFLDIRY